MYILENFSLRPPRKCVICVMNRDRKKVVLAASNDLLASPRRELYLANGTARRDGKTRRRVAEVRRKGRDDETVYFTCLFLSFSLFYICFRSRPLQLVSQRRILGRSISRLNTRKIPLSCGTRTTLLLLHSLSFSFLVPFSFPFACVPSFAHSGPLFPSNVHTETRTHPLCCPIRKVDDRGEDSRAMKPRRNKFLHFDTHWKSI